MSQNSILYTRLDTGNAYFNLPRDLSWVNSKNHEHSDRDGDVLGYLVNVKILGAAANTIQFAVAPNSWKMRNAFKKWHAYRNLMFSEAGVSESEKGRYGKTIRPYLDAGMASGIIKNPALWDLTTQTQEWTYTQIAASPGFGLGAAGTNTGDIVDVYDLNICGENQVSSSTPDTDADYYSAVGMIHSYNQDRQEIVTPTVDSETVEGQNNPLALLRQGGSVSGGQVMDIVEDQEFEKPPYDITDDGASTFVALADIMQVNPGWDGTASVPVLRQTTLFVPAGILKLNCSATDSTAQMMVEVLDIVRCKDMA